MDSIILIIILIALIESAFKKVDIFNEFIEGVKEGSKLLMTLFPTMMASNGSLTVLNNVFLKFGVDHPYSILGSIIQTGSDTTFYVVTLYFGSIKLQNNRYALKLGLWLDIIACLLAIICFLLFIN